MLAGSITPASYAVFNYEHVDTFGRFGILYEGRMSHPQHIAEDSEGNLYVTDLGNKRVQKFASEGVYLDQWGRSGTGPGEFHEPAGIAINQNLVYVVDRDLNRIQVFDLNGKYISQWGERGTDDGKFYFPTSVAVGINGTVYVADSGNQRIQAFSHNGIFISSFGTAGKDNGEFLHLSDVSVDSQGNVYAADKGNGKIEKFDSNGNLLDTIKFYANGWAFAPISVALGPDDSLFILNSIDDRILHLEQDTHTTLMVHERLGPFGDFLSSGNDIMLSETGHLHAVDLLGHKIFKFNTPFVDKSSVDSKAAVESVEDKPETAPEYIENESDVTPETPRPDDTTAVRFDACGLSLDSYNVITGTEGNDIIEGTDSADLIFALGGNDIVSGYGGNDCIFGGDGDDIIFGNDGSDGIFGDKGNDILKGSAGNDTIYGNYGLDSIDGGSDNDVCIAADTIGADLISNCES